MISWFSSLPNKLGARPSLLYLKLCLPFSIKIEYFSFSIISFLNVIVAVPQYVPSNNDTAHLYVLYLLIDEAAILYK